MKNKSKLPKVGDVITSEKFSHAYQHAGYNYISIYGVGSQSAMCQKDITMEDPTRGKAKFVVIKARTEGASQDTNDDYPHYLVLAQRLDDDETYNPEGEIISFPMQSCVYGTVDEKDITIIGKMEKKITFVNFEEQKELPTEGILPGFWDTKEYEW